MRREIDCSHICETMSAAPPETTGFKTITELAENSTFTKVDPLADNGN
jgi:hypothetical protein